MDEQISKGIKNSDHKENNQDIPIQTKTDENEGDENLESSKQL